MNNKFIKNYWHWLILALISLAFFAGTSAFICSSQKDDFIKWGSPDESANYVMAKLYSESGNLTIFEKYNLLSGDIMHLRSLRSDLGVMKPVSFLGIILIYGKIASLIGYEAIPYLTPFFGAIGIIFFYLLVKQLFGRRNALICAFLLASFPVYIYYTVRSLFHNVLFIDLLIIGLFFFIKLMDLPAVKKKFLAKPKLGDIKIFIYPALAGLFVGLAIITRASELLWIAPAFFIIWIFNIRRIGFVKLAIFLCFLFLALMPMFYWNQILYDSALRGGYPEINSSLSQLGSATTGLFGLAVGQSEKESFVFLKQLKEMIFYFGFQPDKSFFMFRQYFVKMFPLFFALFFLGLVVFLQNIYKWRKRHLVYFLVYGIISLILILYYGSWEFYDNPDKGSFTIGNSYTRYWLPIYLGAMPFVALFIIRLSNAIADWKESQTVLFSHTAEPKTVSEYLKNFLNKNLKKPDKKLIIYGVRILAVFVIMLGWLSFVAFGSDEGLAQTFFKTRTAKTEFNEILKQTESSAVIITRYHDKLFFPERKVIVGLFDDDTMNGYYAKLVDFLPVYYYNFTLPEKDLNYLNERRLKDFGLGIIEVKKITADFTLYKLYKVERED